MYILQIDSVRFVSCGYQSLDVIQNILFNVRIPCLMYLCLCSRWTFDDVWMAGSYWFVLPVDRTSTHVFSCLPFFTWTFKDYKMWWMYMFQWSVLMTLSIKTAAFYKCAGNPCFTGDFCWLWPRCHVYFHYCCFAQTFQWWQ